MFSFYFHFLANKTKKVSGSLGCLFLEAETWADPDLSVQTAPKNMSTVHLQILSPKAAVYHLEGFLTFVLSH